MQPSNITLHQHEDAPEAKSYKVLDGCDEGILNEDFIDGVYTSVHHSLRQYCAQNAQADLTEVEFQVELLLSIRKGVGIETKTNQNTYQHGKLSLGEIKIIKPEHLPLW